MASRSHRHKKRQRRKARLDKLAQRDIESRSVRVTEIQGNRKAGSIAGVTHAVTSPGTETTDEPRAAGSEPTASRRLTEGSGFASGLLEDPGRVRSDLQLLRKYMGVGLFTDEQVKGMVIKMGTIVAKGDNRQAIQAFRTLLAQAKLSCDIEQASKPSIHGHVHMDGNRPLNWDDLFDRMENQQDDKEVIDAKFKELEGES